MPTYIVTGPDGREIEIDGDSPPTEQELDHIFSTLSSQPDQTQWQVDVPPAVLTDKPAPQQASFGETLQGLGEAGLTAITGATGGAIGQIGGTIEGILKSVFNKTFGTQEGADQAEQIAMERASSLTYAPKSPEGQKIASKMADYMQNLIPFMGLPANEAAVIANSLKTAGTVAKESPFTYSSPTKQKLLEILQDTPSDVKAAKFKLEYKPGEAPTTDLLGKIQSGIPKIVKDTKATEAIKQGFDEGVIAAVKSASPEDKASFVKMIDIMERGKKNARFAVENRPTDVVGDTFLNQFKVVLNKNKESGKKLDFVAKWLKGKKIDTSEPIKSFYNDLNNLGVKIEQTETGTILNFMGSDIEGLAGPERALKQVFNRVKNGVSDAYEAHRIKRLIDENVSYGKAAEGLTGQSERIVKNLRHNIDSVLDKNFQNYNKVNSIYSETVNGINNFQDAAGRKIDLTGPSAEKSVGRVARRLMSNAQSRENLYNSIQEINSLAGKYGGKFNNDILTQVLFADELDSVFGPVARTSFQGQIGQAVERTAKGIRSPKEALISAGAAAAEKVRGINQENAFKSIKELLKESQGANK